MGRPDLPRGFLGAQSKFAEFGLSTFSHNDSELDLEGNQVTVEVKFTTPNKVTGILTSCESGTEHPEYVFSQTRGDVIAFSVSMPTSGYYKFQIYSLPLPNESNTLIGVFNYLINCKKVTSPVVPYPKQFAQWKEGCYINSPMTLNSANDLSSVRFEAQIPNVKAVAVVASGDWTQLQKNANGLWCGTVSLEKYKGKETKVTLNGNYGNDNKYATLLAYTI